MKFLSRKENIKIVYPIIISTFVAIVIAFVLDYLYERFNNEDVHTVHIIRTYIAFFSYPFIPALIGGIVFASFSKSFIQKSLLINICLLTSYFLFFQTGLNPSEKFVLIFIVFLPIIAIGYFAGNYLGQRVKKLF